VNLLYISGWLKPAKFWNQELVKVWNQRRSGIWNLRSSGIRNLRRSGTREDLESRIGEDLESGTCEVLKTGDCEVRGIDEDLIWKPEQAMIFIRKRFGNHEVAKSKTSSQKSGFEM
jgi:hypothetical protein